MHRSAVPLLAVAVLLVLPVRTDPPVILGFTPAASAVERELESRFRAIPDPARLRANDSLLSAFPHHVGTARDSANAAWIAKQFTDYGWQASIERFEVLFPTPLERRVELVAPTRFTATLREPAVPGDPTSAQQDLQLPTYNAYSGDGDVTAPLVYVNYGIPADYEELARHGIDVKGKIVIARYGGSWRGIKPRVAAEHGAVGCLIYSDPRQDGYAEGAVFPAGPMRPAEGVQRGSVMDMPIYPGDPLTPGVGATKNAKRLLRADAVTIMKIPVSPLSYADAQPLLEALEGPVVPGAWRGGLAITYRFGGSGPARVRLVVKSDWRLHPLFDVIARLPGTTEADQWVVRGNHHDAWVNGAEDPISALVAELEEARALGQLYRDGWRPKRTIIYAAWDGEEPMLLGSTEWAETHADELSQHAVAYINTDLNGRGYLGASGSHSLERFINDVARDIADPETGLTVRERSKAQAIEGGNAELRETARSGGDLPIDALGSGSDYTPFLQHLGIASLDLGFGGEGSGGVYHSIYDDFYWYTHFSDTSFVYGRALAQTVGTAVLRLANADVLPFRFSNLASTTKQYVKELEGLRDRRADEIAERNTQIAEKIFSATSDPRDPTYPPEAKVPPPHLNFAPLENATDSLAAAAKRYEAAYDRWGTGSSTVSAPDLAAINRRLVQSERLLTDTSGLPRRPWYRHLLYAPGYYTGYGVKTMPGVREAIEQGEWSAIDPQVNRLADALNAEAAAVSEMATALGGKSSGR